MAIALLDNDSLTLVHFPAIFKQRATVAFSNFRDSFSEHMWQVDAVHPKVAFVENRLIARYHGPLREKGCTIVAMDPLADDEKLEGVYSFWELVHTPTPSVFSDNQQLWTT